MPRVLVVDDCKDTTDSFLALLRAWGHDAASANDGASALALAAEFRPDVALVDLVMPMGGNEVARRLRALPGLGKALLVAVTGYPGGYRLGPCGELFDAYLGKPPDYAALRHLLDSVAVLEVAGGRSDLSVPPAARD